MGSGGDSRNRHEDARVTSIGPNNRKIDRFLLVLIPAALFVYLSTRPMMRLQADAPPEFLGPSAVARFNRRQAEDRVARAYWDCAVSLVQWEHTYGTPLPEYPPDDFRIDVKTYGSDAASQPTRLRYWNKLRETWLLPISWRQSREWSTAWLTEPVHKAVNWLGDTFRDLFKA